MWSRISDDDDAIHPKADGEFAEAVRYYAAIEPQLGVRFCREIERLIQADSASHQAPQHFLYFLPLPHGQGSLRPTLGWEWYGLVTRPASEASLLAEAC